MKKQERVDNNLTKLYGKVLHDSRASSTGKRVWGLLSLSSIIIIWLFLPLAFPESFFTFKSILSTSVSTIAFIMIILWSADPRIRIYENGFSGPTMFTSYVQVWPKPTMCEDIVGYSIKKLNNDKWYHILLKNGKMIKFWGSQYDKNTMTLFHKVILIKCKQLDKFE